MSRASGKRKKRFLTVVFIGIAVFLTAGLVFFMPVIWNAARYAFSSPAEYYRYVEEKAAGKRISGFCQWYAEIVERCSFTEHRREESTLCLETGEEFWEFIGTTFLGTAAGKEASGIKEIGLDFSAAAEQDGVRAMLSGALSLNQLRVLDTAVFLDLQQDSVYAWIPEFSGECPAIAIEELIGLDSGEIKEFLALLQQFCKAMPKEGELKRLLKRYASLALSCAEEAESGKKVVRAGNVIKECTEVTVTFDGAAVRNVLETLLEEIAADQKLEALVMEVLEVQEGETAKEKYQWFLGKVLELSGHLEGLDEIGEVKMTVWVNQRGEIIGRRFLFGDKSEFSYIALVDGKKIGCKLTLNAGKLRLSLEGGGARKREMYSGKFEFHVMGLRVAELLVTDFNLKDWRDGYLNASATISPSGMLKTLLKKAVGNGLFPEQPKLILSIAEDKKGREIKTVFQNGEELFAALIYRQTERTGERVAVPEKEQLVLLEDRAAFFGWLEEAEKGKLLEKLEEAGVSSVWIRAISNRFLPEPE